MTSKQKTVIVTGASQGIGAGVVQAFLKRGYNVVDTSRSATKSKELQPGRLHLYHTACSQTDAGTEVGGSIVNITLSFVENPIAGLPASFPMIT